MMLNPFNKIHVHFKGLESVEVKLERLPKFQNHEGFGYLLIHKGISARKMTNVFIDSIIIHSFYIFLSLSLMNLSTSNLKRIT